MNAWFCGVPIKGVDVDSFEPVGDGYHYRDVNKVYWRSQSSERREP